MVALKHGKAKCFGQGRECFQLQPLSVQYLILALQKRSSYIESGLCFHKLLEFIILYALLFPGYVDFFPHI